LAPPVGLLSLRGGANDFFMDGKYLDDKFINFKDHIETTNARLLCDNNILNFNINNSKNVITFPYFYEYFNNK
jgi:hypothetical protein